MGDAPRALRSLVISTDYPTPERPHVRTFVGALVEQWRAQGCQVSVLAPEARRPGSAGREAGSGEMPALLRPGYVSYSNRRFGPLFSTFRLTVASFGRAAVQAVRERTGAFDLAYAHFLFPAGAAALAVARQLGIPAVAALGESDLGYYESHLGARRCRETVGGLDGVLAVSRENRDFCLERWGVAPERIALFPNAADTAHFRPRDRDAARRALGLPPDRPLVAFAGHFIERKGPLRVLAALRGLPEVGALFLGDGPQRPQGPQVLHAGRVAHADVPDWLSAADLFVLPTLAEGSPNVIVEAMACGLPIVSSDIPALREAASEAEAILVDPRSPEAIGAAIRALVEDPERRTRMAAAALQRAQGFTLEERARSIHAWLAGIVHGSAAGGGAR